MTATGVQIVWHLIETIDEWPDWPRYNWGCDFDPAKAPDGSGKLHLWDVDDDTYINGVVLTVDLDYHMGYMVEIVERESETVSYMAIALYHGRNPKTGEQAHDFCWYPGKVGTFFDRLVDQSDAAAWAVTQIYAMVDAHEEAEQQARR